MSLLIPGPVTITKNVQEGLNANSLSHTGPQFTTIFQSALQNLKRVYNATQAEGNLPLIIAGSGTLGFDVAGTNFVNPGDNVLLVSTGFFSDEFGECLETYHGANLTVLKPDTVGGVVPLDEIATELRAANGKYRAIVVTHVDTSTAVLNDVGAIAAVTHRESPNTFVIVDAVCSLGCEELQFDKWQLDFVLSASQKAVGAPPGLALGMVSPRALDFALQKRPTGSFYASLKKWAPILQSYAGGQAKYFATQATQLVSSLDTALQELLQRESVTHHKELSEWFRSQITQQLHYKLVTTTSDGGAHIAHGLTALYVDDPAKAIQEINKTAGAIIAGGILPEIKDKYIRVGHMGASATRDTLQLVIEALAASQ
ncbi:alanine--glyoxylate transaminase KNAG_0E03240 [Huiozyma naganishii CBS 8797]|uniref:alanine--glyoxylate transaminase n=1 Tax=Huiozyma naganishii (strain ATCC MYA-139 / BCRC 22969 / CBS 8797 / KCTC 17520 / NBRC 10181 / NCYC 3082 / Yp74L-3) TaxID=1071383 RepID=J7RM15_HUIN7|nr:hypothetical protein KNAG_0E03240 [Kazachstania naganishii CBS 8797]CCK70583.1 hypothetical protein KNAG_0E03240 [Kazachstania naganishii CBS 8797]